MTHKTLGEANAPERDPLGKLVQEPIQEFKRVQAGLQSVSSQAGPASRLRRSGGLSGAGLHRRAGMGVRRQGGRTLDGASRLRAEGRGSRGASDRLLSVLRLRGRTGEAGRPTRDELGGLKALAPGRSPKNNPAMRCHIPLTAALRGAIYLTIPVSPGS